MILNDIAENFKTMRQAVLTNLSILTKCKLVKQAHKGFEIYDIHDIKKLNEINKWPELFRKLRKQGFTQSDILSSIIKKNKK